MGQEQELRRAYAEIDRLFPEHVRSTQEVLRLPSISGHTEGLTETAEWLERRLEGLEAEVRLCGPQEAPIVFARLDSGKPKTLLVYCMYDVQPVEGQVWRSPPFAAEIRSVAGVGPSIIARGACNSKGPLAGFLNALDAICGVSEVPVNLILTIEGEEEVGSPGLLRFYEQNRQRLEADAGFEPFWAEYGTDVDRPTLSLGTKGFVELELICRGGEWGGPAEHPVHSSVGAWVASPTWRLVKAVNTLIGEDEEIRIEGFYDEIAPPTPQDEALLLQLEDTFNEADILARMGTRRFKFPLRGVDLLRKYLFSPTINISVLPALGGDVIPPETRARLIVRLVPEMDPDRTVERIRRHLASNGYDDIEVVSLGGYPGARTRIEERVVQSMIAAYRYHGCNPQILPLSSSATPMCVFSRTLGIPYVWGGLGQAGASHAPDEYVSVEGLRLFEKSIATFLHMYADPW